MYAAVAVHSPQAALQRVQRLLQAGLYLVEGYQAANKACLRNQLRDVGRHRRACGQHHSLCDRRRRQAETRQGPVDYRQRHALGAETAYLLAQQARRRGTAQQHFAAAHHARRHQPTQRCATWVDGNNLRHQPPQAVVLLAGDEGHSVIERYLRFGAAVHSVGLLAVYAYRRHGTLHAQLVEAPQYVVEAHRLAGVLLQPYN